MRDDQVVEVMRRANPVDARTDLGQAYGESWDDALAVLIAGRSGRAADIARVKPLVDVRAGRGWLIAAAAAAAYRDHRRGRRVPREPIDCATGSGRFGASDLDRGCDPGRANADDGARHRNHRTSADPGNP